MENKPNSNEGIKLLVQKCRDEFRHPENMDYYTDKDYKSVERKFVKFCLIDKNRSRYHSKFS